MLVDGMCMQSANTDTTQHAEPVGPRLTWLRTSCFCLTVGTTKSRRMEGGRKGGKSEGGMGRRREGVSYFVSMAVLWGCTI